MVNNIMRATEILNEKSVLSSWITDLTYNRPNKVLTMRLENGISYSISNLARSVFNRWINSPSKGFFFHQYIKDRYQIKRI